MKHWAIALCALLCMAVGTTAIAPAFANAEDWGALADMFGAMADLEDALDTEPSTGGAGNAKAAYAGPTISMNIAGKTVEVHESFKAAMDDYEAFFDEYIAFMENPDMSQYAAFMAKYASAMSALDAMGSEDLSDGDMAYYLEVMTRINQKLILAGN